MTSQKFPFQNQAISIDARKGVWVSAIFSFKPYVIYVLLPKGYMDSNWLTFYNESDVRKIYGMERLFATQVRKIYIMERAMDRLSQRRKSKLRNSTEGNVLWLAEIFTRDRLEWNKSSWFNIYHLESSKTRKITFCAWKHLFWHKIVPLSAFLWFSSKNKKSYVQFFEMSHFKNNCSNPLVNGFCWNSAKMCLIDKNQKSPSLEVLDRAVLELWSIIRWSGPKSPPPP